GPGRHLPRQPDRDRPPPRPHAMGDLLVGGGLPRLDGELQHLLQPDHPDHVLGSARYRHRHRDALRRPAAAVQRDLPVRPGRVIGMRGRFWGALRGCGLGLLAGALWFLIESVGNRVAGGVVSGPTLGTIAAIDVGLGGVAGLLLGAIFPRGGVQLGLAMGAAYGFLRVFEPPGMGAEAVFVLAAAAALVVGGWIARRDARRSGGGVLAFVHTALLGAAAVL